jgi:hypothetical protein
MKGVSISPNLRSLKKMQKAVLKSSSIFSCSYLPIPAAITMKLLQWLNELDKEYKLTDSDYGIGDFIEDLKDKGYIDENRQNGEIKITSKTEQGIRKKSLEEIFGKLKKQNKATTILLNPVTEMR